MDPHIIREPSYFWQKFAFNQNFEYHVDHHISMLFSVAPTARIQYRLSRIATHLSSPSSFTSPKRALLFKRKIATLETPQSVSTHNISSLTLLHTYSTISIPTSKSLPFSFFAPQQHFIQKNFSFRCPPSEPPPHSVSCITSGHNKIRATPLHCANFPAIPDALGLSASQRSIRHITPFQREKLCAALLACTWTIVLQNHMA